MSMSSGPDCEVGTAAYEEKWSGWGTWICSVEALADTGNELAK